MPPTFPPVLTEEAAPKRMPPLSRMLFKFLRNSQNVSSHGVKPPHAMLWVRASGGLPSVPAVGSGTFELAKTLRAQAGRSQAHRNVDSEQGTWAVGENPVSPGLVLIGSKRSGGCVRSPAFAVAEKPPCRQGSGVVSLVPSAPRLLAPALEASDSWGPQRRRSLAFQLHPP